jgi:hypothetical protein
MPKFIEHAKYSDGFDTATYPMMLKCGDLSAGKFEPPIIYPSFVKAEARP